MTFRPGRRLVQGAALLMAGALVAPLLGSAGDALRLVVLAGLGALASASVAEGWLLSRERVALRRPEALALSVGEREVVPIELETTSGRELRAELRQRWPRQLDEPSTVLGARIRAGAPHVAGLPVRAIERGTATLEPASVAVTAWGLVERVVDVGTDVPLSVLPNVKAVGRLANQLDRLALQGLGSRFSAQAGRGREFERLRDYVRGDDLRDVAWKASARHGQLIVRDYRIDRTQDVVVALDCGHRMAARVGDLTRLDHAVDATLMLSWLSGRIEDRIGLVPFGAEPVLALMPGRGIAQQRRMVRALTGVRAQHVHSDHRALAMALRHGLEHRSLVVMFTDLPEGDDEIRALVDAVRSLMPKHLPFVALMSDPDLDATALLLPSDRAELCRTLVAQDLVHRRRQAVLELRRLGALVVTPRPGDAATAAINGYLDVKRRQLL